MTGPPGAAFDRAAIRHELGGLAELVGEAKKSTYTGDDPTCRREVAAKLNAVSAKLSTLRREHLAPREVE